MNRIEEALRRAQRDSALPESFATPSVAALDQFPAAHEATNGHGVSPSFPSEDAASGVAVKTAVRTDAIGPTASGPSSATNGAPTALASLGQSFLGKVVVGGVKPIAVEQYRRLAAALHHKQCDDGSNVVMVVSALASEGKTLTAVNLALTLSESYGRRVLLVDADFRRPTLHDIFQVPNVSGLNDGLMAEVERPLTLIEISPRLSLLPAGRPNPDPMSGLTSDRMRRMLAEAAEKFDWVVIDTPPVGLLTDAHLLAGMVSLAVLVVQAGRTPASLIQRAIDNVGRNRIIGVVLNRVEDRATSPEGKYEHYYSAEYGRRPGGDTSP